MKRNEEKRQCSGAACSTPNHARALGIERVAFVKLYKTKVPKVELLTGVHFKRTHSASRATAIPDRAKPKEGESS